MPRTLVFPDGIRLADQGDLPGPATVRAADWARVQNANIQTGFTLFKSTDTRFDFYAEANVDAPKIWDVFNDLCRVLLGSQVSFVVAGIDDEPTPLGPVPILQVFSILEPHRYQLAHDGHIQFGLVDEAAGDSLTEVFVAPTKHFKVWLSDENGFRTILHNHAVPEVDKLEFIDEYPRITSTLAHDQVLFRDPGELVRHLKNEINRYT